MILDSTLGATVSRTSYGGDAYTGIQNAAATTANNVRDLNSIVAGGFFMLLLILGIAMICYFGIQIARAKRR